MPPSGQRSQGSDSWSMAVNAAPARGSVAGKVAGPGAVSNTARTSGPSTMAWPAMVSTIAAAMNSTVSIKPVQGTDRREPGQSFHQNAIMATAGSANVEIGPRISSAVAVLPVPRARARNTAAVGSRPPSPSHGWAASRCRCCPSTSGGCRRGGVVSSGRSGSGESAPLPWKSARRGVVPVIPASVAADARRRWAVRGPGSQWRGRPRWRSRPRSRPARSRRRP
jgi:hypothetical protein